MLKYSMHSHNAAFVEVKVNEDRGTIQVTRVVNIMAAGRILNPKTAQSQLGDRRHRVGHQHGPDGGRTSTTTSAAT